MIRHNEVDEEHRAGSAWMLVGVLIAIGLVGGAYEVLHGGRRLPMFKGSSEASALPGDVSRSKPSPGIPFGAKVSVAPPPVIAAVPPDSVGVPATIIERAVVGATPVVVKAKDTEGIYTAKHQKSFGRGCEGRLELSASGLDFACSSGSEAPLHFSVDQIKGAQGNGIELKTGEKLHFDLQKSKAEEQELFTNWVFTHVPGAYAKASN